MKAITATAICNALAAICERPNTRCGICTNFVNYLFGGNASYAAIDAAKDWLRVEMRSWPQGTGDEVYPVPGGDFTLAINSGTLWDTSTEYGHNRWALLAYLLERASELEVTE